MFFAVNTFIKNLGFSTSQSLLLTGKWRMLYGPSARC
jgi:hypothetical protein